MCAHRLDVEEEVGPRLTQRDIEMAAIVRDLRKNPHHIHTVVLVLGLKPISPGIWGMKADPFHR